MSRVFGGLRWARLSPAGQLFTIGSRHVPHPRVRDVYTQVYDQEILDTYGTLAAGLKLTPA